MELQVIEYSACVISLVPYAMARMTRVRRGHSPLGQSHLGGAVTYCSILAVAPTIFFFFSCFLRYYHAVTKPADVCQGLDTHTEAYGRWN